MFLHAIKELQFSTLKITVSDEMIFVLWIWKSVITVLWKSMVLSCRRAGLFSGLGSQLRSGTTIGQLLFPALIGPI